MTNATEQLQINTREELLAMPVSDYMNEAQREFFERLIKGQLQEARERLEAAP
jgi:hypothetical protein